MAKLNDLNESERKRVTLDNDGNVLCIYCLKNLAKVSDYGMLRKCDECEKKKDYNVMAIINEHGSKKYY